MPKCIIKCTLRRKSISNLKNTILIKCTVPLYIKWLKYYVLTLKNKYNVLVLMLYFKTLFAAIEV